MRRIFEIEGEPHVSASVHPYSTSVHDRRAWAGARAELLIVDCIEWDKDTRREGDVIEIEGNADALRKMLVDALAILDSNIAINRERKEEIHARKMDCPKCATFADPVDEWHGDGKGNACYGLSQDRLRIITEQVKAEGR